MRESKIHKRISAKFLKEMSKTLEEGALSGSVGVTIRRKERRKTLHGEIKFRPITFFIMHNYCFRSYLQLTYV